MSAHSAPLQYLQHSVVGEVMYSTGTYLALTLILQAVLLIRIRTRIQIQEGKITLKTEKQFINFIL